VQELGICSKSDSIMVREWSRQEYQYGHHQG
jgi:hypothetical protein